MPSDPESLIVVAASSADLAGVMELLLEAQRWQREQGVDVWKDFDPKVIADDIAARCVFVAKAGDRALGTVTLVEADPLVWGTGDTSALYVHRLASSRTAAGRGIGARMLAWAERLARQRGKTCLRLDTWDTNVRMRHYYERLGFRHVRDIFFPSNSPLPADYHGTYKSLYQLDVGP